MHLLTNCLDSNGKSKRCNCVLHLYMQGKGPGRPYKMTEANSKTTDYCANCEVFLHQGQCFATWHNNLKFHEACKEYMLSKGVDVTKWFVTRITP